jgi:hypothetical protein
VAVVVAAGAALLGCCSPPADGAGVAGVAGAGAAAGALDAAG